jgi:PAS domain S-box-containing protein
LHNHNQLLEEQVLERTAELRESKARYRSLIELAADWYWEQDEKGTFTRLYGPVQQMLGIQSDSLASNNSDIAQTVWNEVERSELQTKIASRQPFLDFVISCTNAKGSQQKFQVSGEPMFNQSSRFIGYRGFGVELSLKSKLADLSQ